MKDLAQKALLLLVSTLLAVLVMEVLLTMLLSRQTGAPTRAMELMGFYATPGEVIDGVPINRQGFSGDTVDHPKLPDAVRVLSLGGSVLFNLNMSDRLKHALQANTSRPVEFMGGALRNHTTASSVIKYTGYLAAYDFDVVLIYHGINDLWMNHYAAENFQADYSHYLPHYKRNAVLNHCLLCRLVYNHWYWQSFEKVANGANYRSVETFEHHLRTLIGAIRVRGARPVLMTFATYIPEQYSDERFKDGQAGYAPDLPAHGDYWPISIWGETEYVREGVARHNQVIRHLASELDVELIDQDALFREQAQRQMFLFGDACHFSNEGVDFFVDNVSHYFLQHPL